MSLLAVLKKWFDRHRYLTTHERDALANALDLSPTQVMVWFQNQRTKVKKKLRQQQQIGEFSFTYGT
jgi:hypothetical protein